MKVALVSTCAAVVPPPAYGGIECFVGTLARGLVDRGHDVVVYATGDSHPAGRLRAHFARPVWPPDASAEREHARFALRDVAAFAPDIVHVNLPDALILARGVACPLVATIHGARVPDLASAYIRSNASCVAVSRRQARLLPELRGRLVVIPHGLDPMQFPPGSGDAGYCAFLGRIGPEKAPHLAIDAAREAGVPLRIAGPHWSGVRRYDRYFADEFAPRLAHASPQATWLGELDHGEKIALLRGASVLLFPLGWEEPFGLVMIEAMLVGTPVVAFARGSAPEVVDEGVTGYLVDDVHAMAAAIPRAVRLDRHRCRSQAQSRFGASLMVQRYEALYRSLGLARRVSAA